MPKYNIKVAYETEFEIEAETEEEAKDIACRDFWERDGKAELQTVKILK